MIHSHIWIKLHNSLGLQTMSRLVVFNVAGAGGTGGTGGTTVGTVAASVVAVTTVARVDTVPAMAVLCWLNFAMAVIILANSLVVALAKPNQKILEAGFLSYNIEVY